MRKYLGILCIFFIVFTLTGCKKDSMKSPEKLLEKPVNDEVNSKIYNDIRKLTPLDTFFILPKNATEAGRINIEDLNNDGQKEVIAFKKKQNDSQVENNIIIYIFKLDKNNNIVDESEKTIFFLGDELKSVNFQDIDNDGKKDIIINSLYRGLDSIYVYSYNNALIKRGYFSSNSYDIRLNFYDYNNDGKNEALAIFSDLEKKEISIRELKFSNNNIIFKKYETIVNIDSPDKFFLKNGKVSNSKFGTVLVYSLKNGYFTTQVITYDNNKFVTNFNPGNYKLINPYSLKPYDVLKDGILRFPKIEFTLFDTQPKKANVISWYGWNYNNNSLNSNSIDLIEQIFYCYEYNFKYIIGDDYINKIFVRQKNMNNKIYYIFFDRNNLENKPIFSISVENNKGENYNRKDKDNNLNVLMSNDDYIYYYDILTKDKKLAKEFSFSNIKKNIRILNN